ncbi:hypothetical protein Patl1_32266 [Pistacia atlantica]|uniref:Uncharacterized protein n=1 Tax=Pistacia atlantica TaxID=434234 RepID=A0ACC1AN28_9ROSI|nr:hypothetical protein Patl1_32266 [Pistacia atlantica]
MRRFLIQEYFVVPGLPKAQLPGTLNAGSVTFKDMLDEIKAADEASYGLVFNSFQELEERYVEECRKVKGDKVWCVGPVSLCNKDNISKGQRGNKTSIDEKECLKWLNSWPSKSVVYACLGTPWLHVTSAANGTGTSLRSIEAAVYMGYKRWCQFK